MLLNLPGGIALCNGREARFAAQHIALTLAFPEKLMIGQFGRPQTYRINEAYKTKHKEGKKKSKVAEEFCTIGTYDVERVKCDRQIILTDGPFEPYHTKQLSVGCMVQWQNVGLWPANMRSTCSWRVTICIGKPSAVGHTTRPTGPFILSGSIDE